jgi:hypothetical protein
MIDNLLPLIDQIKEKLQNQPSVPGRISGLT